MSEPVSPADTIRRLTEWVDDPLHVGRSVRSHEPTYRNPGELRRDVRALLAVGERDKAERYEELLDAERRALDYQEFIAWTLDEFGARMPEKWTTGARAILADGQGHTASGLTADQKAIYARAQEAVKSLSERDRRQIAQLTEVGKAAMIVAELNGERRSTYGREVTNAEFNNAMFALEVAVNAARAVLAGEERLRSAAKSLVPVVSCGEVFAFRSGGTLYTTTCELPQGHVGAHSLVSQGFDDPFVRAAGEEDAGDE